MSQFVKINASGALNNGAAEGDQVRGERFATHRTVYGRPMYPKQRSIGWRKVDRNQTSTPMTTMTPSVWQANPRAETTQRKAVHYFLGKGDAIKLQTSKNAWVPPCMRPKGANNCQPLSEEDAQIEDIRKKFMAILNKISPENMELLTDQILSLPIDTEKCLKKVIELLFQKAIDEPNFTPQYAFICTAMQTKEINLDDKDASFGNLLTKCCQDRLCQMRVHEETLAKNLRAIKDCEDKEIKEQLQSKYDQDEMVYRKKSVGNCRFMCELYKVQILTNTTLVMSIKYLLQYPNEETVECACNILKHTGQTLSHEDIFNKLNEYTTAAYKTKIPTRIRFMIQDTIELRDNNWIPRNARKNNQFHNTSTSLDTIKTAVNKQWRPVEYVTPAPIVFSKVDVCPNNEVEKSKVSSGVKEQSQSMSSSVIVQSNKPLVLPCAAKVTESTNNGRCTKEKNIAVEEIQNKCQSILDSINAENMVQVAKRMIALPIKTDDDLKTVVELVFQKAIDEPKLTSQYAHICTLMENVEVKSNDRKTKATFGILLVATCQKAFESMFNRKRMVAKDRNAIETCKDKNMRKQLQSKFDKNELDHNRRSVACCRFMCDLLKVNILIAPVLDMCATKLLESPKETYIECVCVLLNHTGTALNYSDILEKLREFLPERKHKLSPRIRTMVLDTLELKNRDLTRDGTGEKALLLGNIKVKNCTDSPIENIKPTTTDVVMPIVGETIPKDINIDKAVKEQVQNKPPPDRQLNDYKTVKSIIYSVTAENVNTKIKELSSLITNIDVMEKTIDFIFAKANIRPESIPELVCVCSSLKNMAIKSAEGHTKPISLKKQILIRCTQVLQSGVKNDSSGDGFTHKEPYAFVGELFNANVLSAHTLLQFLQIIPDKLTNRGLDNTCCLLKAAGKKLEQAQNLKKTIEKLKNMVSNDMEGMYSQRSIGHLIELVELRDEKWVSLN